MTIQELAKEAGSYFYGAKRASGESYRKLKNGRPEWVYEMVREAHGDMLPDDWRYGAIEYVLSMIEQSEDPDEMPEFEADVYNSELYAWLASNHRRAAYCDDAQAEDLVGEDATMADRIMGGQVKEYQEIWGFVIESLRERANALEEEIEAEE